MSVAKSWPAALLVALALAPLATRSELVMVEHERVVLYRAQQPTTAVFKGMVLEAAVHPTVAGWYTVTYRGHPFDARLGDFLTREAALGAALKATHELEARLATNIHELQVRYERLGQVQAAHVYLDRDAALRFRHKVVQPQPATLPDGVVILTEESTTWREERVLSTAQERRIRDGLDDEGKRLTREIADLWTAQADIRNRQLAARYAREEVEQRFTAAAINPARTWAQVYRVRTSRAPYSDSVRALGVLPLGMVVAGLPSVTRRGLAVVSLTAGNFFVRQQDLQPIGAAVLAVAGDALKAEVDLDREEAEQKLRQNRSQVFADWRTTLDTAAKARGRAAWLGGDRWALGYERVYHLDRPAEAILVVDSSDARKTIRDWDDSLAGIDKDVGAANQRVAALRTQRDQAKLKLEGLQADARRAAGAIFSPPDDAPEAVPEVPLETGP